MVNDRSRRPTFGMMVKNWKRGPHGQKIIQWFSQKNSLKSKMWTSGFFFLVCWVLCPEILYPENSQSFSCSILFISHVSMSNGCRWWLQGPYVNKAKPSAVDFNLAPKLYHLEIALGHFKSWTIPENLNHLRAYLDVSWLSLLLSGSHLATLTIPLSLTFCPYKVSKSPPRLKKDHLITHQHQGPSSSGSGSILLTMSPVQLLFNQESFSKTKAAREHVIAGWAPKVEAWRSSPWSPRFLGELFLHFWCNHHLCTLFCSCDRMLQRFMDINSDGELMSGGPGSFTHF